MILIKNLASLNLNKLFRNHFKPHLQNHFIRKIMIESGMRLFLPSSLAQCPKINKKVI